MVMPNTLAEPVYAELEIKKSRFLTWVEPVASGAAAKQRLAEIRKQYPDARHVCFAFYVEGSSGMSDDGEPSGTAGKPMFNVLNHKKLENVLAVIVRYFGGIKLGAGGLARAYGGAVSHALENADIKAIETIHTVQVQFPFALESSVRRVCDKFSIGLEQVEYRTEVNAQVLVSEPIESEFQAAFLAVAPANPGLVYQLEDS